MTLAPGPYASLVGRLSGDPAAPWLTDLDLATGDRVELSVASAVNGVAKAAHLVSGLADELGTAPRIAVRLPLHWQAITLVLGAWAGGACVVENEEADVVVLGPWDVAAPPPLTGLPDQVWASRLHPFGLPLAPAPAFPVEDLTTLLRAQPDQPPRDRATPSSVAVELEGRSFTIADLLAQAAEHDRSLGPQGRLLTCLDWSTSAGFLAGAVLPAQAGRSVVVVRGADTEHPGSPSLARVCASERVTATAGLDVAGLPRLL